MKKKIVMVSIIAFFALVFAAAQTAVTAQSAQDAMSKSKAAEKQGRQAFDDGFYDDAIQLAGQAESYAILAKNWYRASGLLKQAETRVMLAIRYKIDTREPDLYKTANTTYTQASTEYKAQQFEQSTAHSLQVMELLKDITPPPPAVSVAASLPEQKTYTVKKKIPADCFWRIAGYPEIYGDPAKWRLIYEANKQKLQNPNNPNLIQPGMVFVIPPLKK